MAAVNIRIATLDDAPAMSVLTELLGFASDPDLMARRLVDLHDCPFFRAWVAETAGQVVGLLTLNVVPYINTEHDGAQIVTLVVAPEHRRKGVASALVHTAEAFAREAGCCTVKLFADRSRTVAHSFYEALGYRMDTDKTRFNKVLDP